MTPPSQPTPPPGYRLLEERFWKSVKRGNKNECWPWRGLLSAYGYGVFVSKETTRAAHRIAWWLHTGKHIQEGMECAHLCHNKACVNPSHLSEVTHSENMLQSARAKRLPLQNDPEKTNLRKLSRSAIYEIRGQPDTPKNRERLRKKFSVHPTTIGHILNRKTWKHI